MFITDKLRHDVEPVLTLLSGEADFLREGLAVLSQLHDVTMKRFVMRALERSLQVAVEGIADVGNALIDALLMRDPSSYADIIAVLCDEQVVDESLAFELTEVVMIRKVLVQEYLADHEREVLAIARRHMAITAFVQAVRTYMS